MKIRAIIPNDPDNASNFWRIIRPFVALKSHGHDCEIYWHDSLKNLDVKDAIVIIHRVIPAHPKQYVEKLYKSGANCVVYSVDDLTLDGIALRQYLTDCGGITKPQIDKFVADSQRARETVLYCDELLTTTVDLADMSSRVIHPKTGMTVLTNAIDETWFLNHMNTMSDYSDNGDRVYIGWAGGRRPVYDLEYMAKAWGRISREFDNVYFVVAGYQTDIIDKELDLDRKIRLPFRPLDDWPKSMQVDIGCCPLTPTPFNSGKSVIKFYEYTMGGAAVVASNFLYETAITHGLTGYLAASEDEWYECLIRLIDNKVRRKQMQQAAYYETHNYNTMSVRVDSWEYQLKRLLS